MKKSTDKPMRSEYDFSKGVRGKHADRLAKGATLVSLDPDVAEAFPDASAVNKALRKLLPKHSTGTN